MSRKQEIRDEIARLKFLKQAKNGNPARIEKGKIVIYDAYMTMSEKEALRDLINDFVKQQNP